jgi:hypothetical protein
MAKDRAKQSHKQTNSKPAGNQVGKLQGSKRQPTKGLGQSTAKKSNERFGAVKEVVRDNRGRQR